MTNAVLYESLSVTGAPLTATLVSIDGGLMVAIGLGTVLAAGVLVSAALRSARRRRRIAVQSVMRVRRATA